MTLPLIDSLDRAWGRLVAARQTLDVLLRPDGFTRERLQMARERVLDAENELNDTRRSAALTVTHLGGRRAGR